MAENEVEFGTCGGGSEYKAGSIERWRYHSLWVVVEVN